MPSMIDLPTLPFSYSASQTDAGDKAPAMVPSVSAHHVYLPFQTVNQYGSRDQTIKALYRGNAYYVSGVHLYRDGKSGQWGFQYSDSGERAIFTPDAVLYYASNHNQPARQTPPAYWTTRQIYGDMTETGKALFARAILKEWSAFCLANQSAIDAAMTEAAKGAITEKRAELEAKRAELAAEIAKLDGELAELAD